jgi:hypothetical protein
MFLSSHLLNTHVLRPLIEPSRLPQFILTSHSSLQWRSPRNDARMERIPEGTVVPASAKSAAHRPRSSAATLAEAGATQEQIVQALGIAITVSAGAALVYSSRFLNAYHAKSRRPPRPSRLKRRTLRATHGEVRSTGRYERRGAPERMRLMRPQKSRPLKRTRT